MLGAMLDGCAHTASELATLGGVTAQTASGHLAKLVHGGLATASKQGRRRYCKLATADVARMLEAVMVVAAQPTAGAQPAAPNIEPEMRRARSCYDHLAGELGVALADRLARSGAVVLSFEAATVTDHGWALPTQLGIKVDRQQRSRRPLCRPCLDWSERRPHLAGWLGKALLDHALNSGIVLRQHETRALELTGSIADVLTRLGLPPTRQKLS